ncbi:MAG: DUF1016 N-terminal domain-containing protein [Bacteroidetes bacterium]|nr:DUF1016 N-terminal domain-containing protein [Bacteroidota bacterium]
MNLYKKLLLDIKSRIRQGQIRANLSANAELLATYWDIGSMIFKRQLEEGWGKRVIPRLARDLKDELVEVKGTFYKEYPNFLISPTPLAKLENTRAKTDCLQNIHSKTLISPLVFLNMNLPGCCLNPLKAVCRVSRKLKKPWLLIKSTNTMKTMSKELGTKREEFVDQVNADFSGWIDVIALANIIAGNFKTVLI